MKSDLEISNEAKLQPIVNIGQKIGINQEDMSPYGLYKAKVNISIDSLKPTAKLILVTAITPTKAGEGKTTMSIGLADGLNHIGKKTALALRQPSLGPVFGIKGGATGGGYAQVAPMEEINLHFTGDIHAISIAHNLISAVLENHIYQGNELNIDESSISWKRNMDMCDRSLKYDKENPSSKRRTFMITAASEVMATFCLSSNLDDLKKRLGRIVVARNTEGKAITVKDLKVDGAATALLKEAFKPNIAQTLEATPTFIHGGPFANIAHGCNSIVATKMAMHFADYVVTEAGFAADLGAEKFLDIKCPTAGLKPSAILLVATIRALKLHGGQAYEDLKKPNLQTLEAGFANLDKHMENLSKYGVPFVVTINHFADDSEEEVSLLKSHLASKNVAFSLSDAHTLGGAGSAELAHKIIETIESKPNTYKPIYNSSMSLKEKMHTIATQIYGADDVSYSDEAETELAKLSTEGYDNLPVCVSKTQNSLSDNAKALGRPTGFTVHISSVRLNAGSGFVVMMAGAIIDMPGLPKEPSSNFIDIDKNGKITGLF